MSEKETIIWPQVFTLGSIGPQGQRAFYFQCVPEDTSRVFSIKCEKEQVMAIADVLEFLLDNMPPEYNIPLEELEPETPEASYIPWTVGDLSIMYSWEKDQIELVLTELVEKEQESQTEQESKAKSMKFILTREQADGFARMARMLISLGRPLCVFCGDPLNSAPESDFCPCWN